MVRLARRWSSCKLEATLEVLPNAAVWEWKGGGKSSEQQWLEQGGCFHHHQAVGVWVGLPQVCWGHSWQAGGFGHGLHWPSPPAHPWQSSAKGRDLESSRRCSQPGLLCQMYPFVLPLDALESLSLLIYNHAVYNHALVKTTYQRHTNLRAILEAKALFPLKYFSVTRINCRLSLGDCPNLKFPGHIRV